MAASTPLRELRQLLGLSQEEFAERIGRCQAWLSRMEAAGSPGRLGRDVLVIATKFRVEMLALGLDVEDLMRGTREREVPPPTRKRRRATARA